MLTDPQTITVNAVAKTMPKVSSTGTSTTYQLADKSFKLTISHQESKGRIRSLAKVEQRAVVADPLTSVNDYETLALHVVVDRPEVGFSSTQVDQLVAGFKTWLDSTMVGKLYGQES
jgi:hypothetical protein